MQVCKGIFWYEPNEHKLFTVKVRCNEKGIALEPVIYSSKSGENFNHKVEWAKLPKEITNGNPYNYYPRGRVEVKKGKVKIFLHPVLNRFDIEHFILEEFEILGKRITVQEIPDGSKHYEYLIDFEPTRCNMCGKLFDEWDYQEKFSFKSYIGYGSKYDLNKIDLNLCCSCFDKVMDFIIPQCKIIPLEEYD